MRKNSVFFILTVFTSVLFSCNFQIPTAVEIRGNPDIKLAAKKDLGEAFKDLFSSSGDYSLISCVNTVTRTYMLRKAFDGASLTFPTGSGTISVSPDHRLGSNVANVSVDFGTAISGFTLKPAVARVFVDGNENLLNHLIIKVTVTGDTENYNNFNKGVSGVLDDDDEYTGSSMPGHLSTDIPLPLDATNLEVEFEVFLEAGTYESVWFEEDLNSEILVWVPLIFTADDDNAKIVIPRGTLFPVDEDLFGRSSGDSNSLGDYVESLELSIVLKKNPFIGRLLVITSTGDNTPDGLIEIEHTMRGNNFSFPIDKSNMEKLNDPSTIPFEPNFTIKYKENDLLEFPWDLSSTTFVFKAKINHRVEF